MFLKAEHVIVNDDAVFDVSATARTYKEVQVLDVMV
jgi:hypothetical protein